MEQIHSLWNLFGSIEVSASSIDCVSRRLWCIPACWWDIFWTCMVWHKIILETVHVIARSSSLSNSTLLRVFISGYSLNNLCRTTEGPRAMIQEFATGFAFVYALEHVRWRGLNLTHEHEYSPDTRCYSCYLISPLIAYVVCEEDYNLSECFESDKYHLFMDTDTDIWIPTARKPLMTLTHNYVTNTATHHCQAQCTPTTSSSNFSTCTSVFYDSAYE